MSLRWRIWNIYRHRALAAFFGAISDRIEAIHDRLHPTMVTAYQCAMCVERANPTEYVLFLTFPPVTNDPAVRVP